MARLSPAEDRELTELLLRPADLLSPTEGGRLRELIRRYEAALEAEWRAAQAMRADTEQYGPAGRWEGAPCFVEHSDGC